MRSPANDHLDEPEGRIWLRLEWRALGRSLTGNAEEELAAVRDAVLFRARRHELFPDGAENERRL